MGGYEKLEIEIGNCDKEKDQKQVTGIPKKEVVMDSNFETALLGGGQFVEEGGEWVLENCAYSPFIPEGLSQIDRDLYEHLPQNRTTIFRPRTQGSTPKSQQLAKKFGCTQVQGVALEELFRIIEPDEKLIKEFQRWTKVKGIAALIKYLTGIAAELIRDENPDEVLSGSSKVTSLDDLELLNFDFEVNIEQDELIAEATEFEPVSGNPFLPLSEFRVDYYASNEEKPGKPEVIEIATTNSDNWIWNQPSKFKMRIEKLKTIPNKEALSELVQKLAKESWSPDQTRVLGSYIKAAWSRFKIPPALSSTHPLFQKLQRTKTSQDLKRFGKSVFSMIRKGILKISKQELTGFWNLYKIRKLALS